MQVFCKGSLCDLRIEVKKVLCKSVVSCWVFPYPKSRQGLSMTHVDVQLSSKRYDILHGPQMLVHPHSLRKHTEWQHVSSLATT